MKGSLLLFFLVCLACSFVLCESGCVREYSQEEADMAHESGDPYIDCAGKMCTFDGCNTVCCPSDGICTQTLRVCTGNRKREWKAQFANIVASRVGVQVQAKKEEQEPMEKTGKEWTKALRK